MRFIDLLEFKIKENSKVYFDVPISKTLNSFQKSEILECIEYALLHFQVTGKGFMFQYRDINSKTLESYGVPLKSNSRYEIREWLIEKFLKHLTSNDVKESRKTNDSVAFIFKVPTRNFSIQSTSKIPRLYIKFQFIFGVEYNSSGKTFILPSSESDHILVSIDHMILNEISFHQDRKFSR